MRIRRSAALIGVSAIASASLVFTAIPAQADTGDILITEENSSGTGIGVADDALGSATVPDTAGDIQRHMVVPLNAGGHQVGLTLELEH